MKLTHTVTLAVLAIGLSVYCGEARAQAAFPADWFEVPFRGGAGTFRARISAPEGASAPLPAVVVAHGSSGVDRRAIAYVAALRAAGIVSMEIEMFKPGGRPGQIADTIPHAIGALEYLATNAAIDPDRIGMMGFSWGGGLSLALAQERYYSGYGPRRFAALVPLYPVCNYTAKLGAAQPTGKPMMILAGGKDDYDSPGDCPTVAASFNRWTADVASVHVYPDATHIWDSLSGPTSFSDRYANRGSGGTVKVVPDAATAADSVARTTAFFVDKLRAGAR
jgi:dienelactone hydrolase